MDDHHDGRPFDAAIVGAGLAGSALAIRLATRGARVALIDAGRFPREKLCGEYLSPEGAAALERLGLGRAIEAAGARPIRRARLTTPSGPVVDAEVVGPDGRPGLGLSRARLDALLLDEARDRGATVLEGTRIAGPIVDGGRVIGVAGRTIEGESIEIRPSVVVAADGRHSCLARRAGRTRVRSLPGLRPSLFGLKRHLHVCDQRDDEPPGTVGLHLIPGGYVGAVRVEGGRTNLCGLLPDRLSKRHRGDLDALAADAFPANPRLSRLWSAAVPDGPWKTVANVRVQATRPLLPGVFPVGDARGTVDPLGGQGMTMALLGAELTAPYVLRALSGDDRAAVADCLRDWHRRFDRRVLLCRAFHHALVRPEVIATLGRLGRFGERVLAVGFAATRDRAAIVGEPVG